MPPATSPNKKIRNPLDTHELFLTSLNEQVIRPFNIDLPSSYASAQAGTPQEGQYTVPSDRDVYVHGIKAWMQRDPDDTTENTNMDKIYVQLNANPTDLNFWNQPVPLSSFAAWPEGRNDYMKLPVPWRIQGGALIRARFQALPGLPDEERAFSLQLITEVVIIKELDRLSGLK